MQETVRMTATDSEVLRVAAALGFAGFFCLAAAVAWGIASAMSPWPGVPIRTEAVEQGHLAWAIAGIVLVAAHVLAHTLRPVAPLSWVDGFVPFATGGWVVAVGVTGWLLLLAGAGAVLVQRRLGYTVWVTVHRAAYAGFVLMAGHVVVAASDDKMGRLTWVGVAVSAAMTAVIAMTLLRLRAARTTGRPATAWSFDP